MNTQTKDDIPTQLKLQYKNGVAMQGNVAVVVQYNTSSEHNFILVNLPKWYILIFLVKMVIGVPITLGLT